METLQLPDLTNEQIEQICIIAEEAARNYVLSKVSSKKIESLNISAQAEGAKPMKLEVDLAITLTSSVKDINVQKIADEAVKHAFSSIEKQLKVFACHSQK